MQKKAIFIVEIHYNATKKYFRSIDPEFLRNQNLEESPPIGITDVIRQGMESFRDWMACIDTATHSALTKFCSS